MKPETNLLDRLPRATGAVALLLFAVLGCGPPQEPTSSVLRQLAGGVLLEYGRPIALGQPQRLGDHPDIANWAPLPFSAGEGWLRPARSGWTPLGARAVFRYSEWDASPERPAFLRLDFRRRADEAKSEQRVSISVGGEVVGSTEIAEGLQQTVFALPAGPLSNPVEIALDFDPPIERTRPRALSIAAFGLGGETAVREEPSFGGSPTLDSESGTLRLERSGRLVAPLALAGSTTAVEIEWRCVDGGGSLVVTGIDDRGNEREVASFDRCPDRWQRDTLPLQVPPRGGIVLSMDVQLDDGGALEMRRAGVVTAEAPEPTPTSPIRKAATRPTHPDILLIILDAARGQEFGFAGYPRDTSPNLDRLAETSLIFERAFSECPNTACSIPNLITGVPFQNVGTVFKGKRIPDELTTLAEYLGPLGYRTVGFSANPNNSEARNSHQGFDRFERLWGAHNQADLAREEIAQQPADEPLYLQLHFLPPHQPYRPRPEFDIFTDPDYSGPVKPQMSLRRYSEGYATFTPEDVLQLQALYDGNLRMVDDAIEGVFAAMRESGRWENALVVVTSDHGEAFGEHGAFSHNRTLFDEMLHVPLVVRLPGDERPQEVGTGERVILSDVVPTILGYIGLPPKPEVLGVDLLAADPDLLAARILFHRTLHRRRSQLGARGPRFYALGGRNGRWPLLFDQVDDPRQLTDLAADRPDVFAGLTLRLRDFIALSEMRMPSDAEDVELSEDEIETLRALGYVE